MREFSVKLRHNRYIVPVAVFRPGDLADLDYAMFSALLDTGATVSGVGPAVVRSLSLASYGKNRLGSATEEVFADYYLFRIGLFSTEQLQERQPDPINLRYLFDEIDGFSWSRQTDFDVIIGMDVLSRCDLHLNRYGRCIMQFG